MLLLFVIPWVGFVIAAPTPSATPNPPADEGSDSDYVHNVVVATGCVLIIPGVVLLVYGVCKVNKYLIQINAVEHLRPVIQEWHEAGRDEGYYPGRLFIAALPLLVRVLASLRPAAVPQDGALNMLARQAARIANPGFELPVIRTGHLGLNPNLAPNPTLAPDTTLAPNTTLAPTLVPVPVFDVPSAPPRRPLPAIPEVPVMPVPPIDERAADPPILVNIPGAPRASWTSLRGVLRIKPFARQFKARRSDADRVAAQAGAIAAALGDLAEQSAGTSSAVEPRLLNNPPRRRETSDSMEQVIGTVAPAIAVAA